MAYHRRRRISSREACISSAEGCIYIAFALMRYKAFRLDDIQFLQN